MNFPNYPVENFKIEKDNTSENNDWVCVIFLLENKNTITLRCIPDCCSQNYLVFTRDLFLLKGCKITDIKQKSVHRTLDKEEERNDTMIDYTIFYEENGVKKHMDFSFHNESSIYYEGHLDILIGNTPPTFLQPEQLILCVGLPGSGKSFLGTHTYSSYTIYDDDTPIDKNKIEQIKLDLFYNKQVYLSSTRFCKIENYLQFIENLNIKNQNYITTICIKPDVEQSIKNIKHRMEKTIKNDKKWIKTIQTYAKVYDVKEDYIHPILMDTIRIG